VHVAYGIVGLKTHAKICLVVRREGHGLRRYLHLGTGNYNPGTARIYTDFSFFTDDQKLAEDGSDLFNYLTGYSEHEEYQELLVAPVTMRARIIREIEEETEKAKNGEPARITCKTNSLTDPQIIELLYEASQAGVKIDLIVRSICCLRPGVEGVSENIRAVSVVGSFLEHSRIYGFRRGYERSYFIGSADLMPRNLDTRVELLVPVEDAGARAEIEDTLERCFADDTFAWDMQPDGAWKRRSGARRSVHRELMNRAHERAAESGATSETPAVRA